VGVTVALADTWSILAVDKAVFLDSAQWNLDYLIFVFWPIMDSSAMMSAMFSRIDSRTFWR